MSHLAGLSAIDALHKIIFFQILFRTFLWSPTLTTLWGLFYCDNSTPLSTNDTASKVSTSPSLARLRGGSSSPWPNRRLSVIAGFPDPGACHCHRQKLPAKPAGHRSSLDLPALVITPGNCRCRSGRAVTVFPCPVLTGGFSFPKNSGLLIYSWVIVLDVSIFFNYFPPRRFRYILPFCFSPMHRACNI